MDELWGIFQEYVFRKPTTLLGHCTLIRGRDSQINFGEKYVNFVAFPVLPDGIAPLYNTVLILDLCPANHRQRYFVTTSLIAPVQA